MDLRPIYGHDVLLDRLDGALASGRFPQATLFVGPPGVGKQRLALWVAQGLLCEYGPGAPCGECGPCHRALGLVHPDVHWFVPIPRPKASDPGKQIEEARDTLAALLEDRRQTALWTAPEGMASHSLASVRLLQRSVALTPFEGRRKVVILGDAERLVVQEASPEAANAMLKVLEEPPADTTLILTAADPQALLPTIRSRLIPFRVPRVTDEAVRRFLTSEIDPPPEGHALERLVVLAEGGIGRALAGLDGAEDDADRAAQALLDAVRKGPEVWLPLALKQPPWAARGDFSAALDALAVRIRARLEEGAALEGAALRPWLEALRRVERTRAEAQTNANPQLALAVLAEDLEALL
ncbi:MAG: ATP-binding protein [Gemmatimonadales bacterium]